MGSGNKSTNIFFRKNNFIGSFDSLKNIPAFDNFLECCFVGRSNAGKSSIINSITKNRYLAKISKTPGRTQSINMFNIGEKLILVDLPGYGYAKLSKIVSVFVKNGLILIDFWEIS